MRALAGVVGQYVDVEGAEVGRVTGQGPVSSSRRSGVVVLQDDDQVGQGGLADVVGDSEVDAGVGRDPGHGDHVDVLDQQRADAAGHHRGDGAGHQVHGGERGEQGGLVFRARMEAEDGPGDQGQGPLGPDDELGQVVAAGGLHEPAARGDDLARAQYGLEAEDVVAGDPVLDGPHAPGVGGHVAAEAGRLLPGEHRVDETQRGQRRVQIGQGHARLDHGHLVGRIDLLDGGHALEGDHDPAFDRDRRARQSGARPAGRDRNGQLRRGHHHGRHLLHGGRDGPRRPGVRA